MFITEKNYNRVHVIGEKNGKCIIATVKEILRRNRRYFLNEWK